VNRVGRLKVKRIAKFEKVSITQFTSDWSNTFGECCQNCILQVYGDIPLPQRATSGSAGYDFFAPITIHLLPGESILIPTGVRVWMEANWVLQCYPRSGLGFKYRLQLNNTVGIIDSDYYYAKNEGHIFARLTNDSNEGKTVEVPAGTGFMQGIFIEYGITIDDEVEEKRTGGLGSTTRSVFES